MRKHRHQRVENVGPLEPYVRHLLRKITDGKTLLHFRKNQRICSEGEKADAIYFIQIGKVKITVLSATGKEAVLSLLGPGDFFGEGCLAGQSLRVDAAATLESSSIFRVEKAAMQRALHDRPELCEKFMAALLIRNVRLKEDLSDQFFNHSERRLARVLVKLARLGQNGTMPDVKLTRISHEALAEMVGTTRSRITQFMNKFRKNGFIDYDGELTIRPGPLTEAMLRD